MNVETIRKLPAVVKAFNDKGGRRFANIESNRACNRDCSYCMVPQQYKQEEESTVAENLQQVDWLKSNGFKVLSYLGGEPFAPFRTKEGITFADHTKEVVTHAAKAGMIVNVTTNGDFVTPQVVDDMKKAGLDSMTFSLHSYTEPGVKHITKGAKLAANAKIVAAVNTVFTTERTDTLPGVAGYFAENGILFSVGIVNEKGGGLSASNEGESKVPTEDEQRNVLASLLRLKTYGFVRNNRNYLKNAPDYPNNSWTCNPEQDNFVHIGAGGKVDICSDVRTDLSFAEVDFDSTDWRELRRDLVHNCGNCMYSCYYETENPDMVGDLPTYALMLLVKSGNAGLVERIGKFAVDRLRKNDKTTNWNISV